MYFIKEVNTVNGEDKVLRQTNERGQIPFLLEELGFADCKTKLTEEGEFLYYRGKRAVYVLYSKK